MAPVPTRGAPVEVVVILGDVSQDAEAVGDLKSHHVFGVQQGGNSQLLLRNPEGLEIRNAHLRPRGRTEKRLFSPRRHLNQQENGPPDNESNRQGLDEV